MFSVKKKTTAIVLLRTTIFSTDSLTTNTEFMLRYECSMFDIGVLMVLTWRGNSSGRRTTPISTGNSMK